MATAQQAADIFRGIAQALRNTVDKEAEIVANDLLALVRDRVQNDKEKADGSIFGKYSEAYEKVRDNNNLFGGDINLTFTGEMWASAGVEVDSSINGTSSARIEFKGGLNQDKAFWNSERYGNILEASEDELNAVQEAYQERRLDFIDQLLQF